jgi:hypothetical protein
MYVDNLFGTKDLATETGNAVLAKFYDRQGFPLVQTRHAGRHQDLGHVNDVGGADEIADATACTAIKVDVFDHS